MGPGSTQSDGATRFSPLVGQKSRSRSGYISNIIFFKAYFILHPLEIGIDNFI